MIASTRAFEAVRSRLAQHLDSGRSSQHLLGYVRRGSMALAMKEKNHELAIRRD